MRRSSMLSHSYCLLLGRERPPSSLLIASMTSSSSLLIRTCLKRTMLRTSKRSKRRRRKTCCPKIFSTMSKSRLPCLVRSPVLCPPTVSRITRVATRQITTRCSSMLTMHLKTRNHSESKMLSHSLDQSPKVANQSLRVSVAFRSKVAMPHKK